MPKGPTATKHNDQGEILKPKYNKVDRTNNNTTYDKATSARKDDNPYNKKRVKNINTA